MVRTVCTYIGTYIPDVLTSLKNANCVERIIIVMLHYKMVPGTSTVVLMAHQGFHCFFLKSLKVHPLIRENDAFLDSPVSEMCCPKAARQLKAATIKVVCLTDQKNNRFLF